MVIAPKPSPLSNKDSPPNPFAPAPRNTNIVSHARVLRLDCISALANGGSRLFRQRMLLSKELHYDHCQTLRSSDKIQVTKSTAIAR